MSTLDSDVLFWPASLDSDVPMGPAPAYEIFTAGPVNHVTVGVDRLLQQFKGEAHPLIQALVAAPLVVSNRLEGVLWTLLTETGLANAVGWWLDEWGAIVGLERDGWDDDRYRELIHAWLLALRSHGTVEEIYDVVDALQPSAGAWVGGIIDLPLDPASFRLTLTDPVLDDTTAELYARFIRARVHEAAGARAAGVRVWFYTYPLPEDELFTLADAGSVLDATDGAALGLGDFDDTDGPTGGGLAREVIA